MAQRFCDAKHCAAHTQRSDFGSFTERPEAPAPAKRASTPHAHHSVSGLAVKSAKPRIRRGR